MEQIIFVRGWRHQNTGRSCRCTQFSGVIHLETLAQELSWILKICWVWSSIWWVPSVCESPRFKSILWILVKKRLKSVFWWILECGFDFDTSCDRPCEVYYWCYYTEVLIALQGKCCQTILYQEISLNYPMQCLSCWLNVSHKDAAKLRKSCKKYCQRK